MTDSLAERLGTPVPPVLPEHELVRTWRAPTEADIDAVHAVFVAADLVDHPTWTTPRQDVVDYFTYSHVDLSRDLLVAEDRDGTVVAAGMAMLHPSRENGLLTVNVAGAVHPDFRRKGIGGALLRWLDARGREQLAETARALPDGGATGELKVYAGEQNRDLVALAEGAGYAPTRWFTTMVRDLTAPLPEVAVPDGIRLVPYTPDREADAMDARNDAFRDHWGSRPTLPETWHSFVAGDFLRGDLSTLALDADGRIVAFCLASVNEDDWVTLGAPNSYIDLIGVVRDHRRQGLAPLVVANSLAAMRADGLEKAVLDVDTASPTGAHSLYEGLGFAATERDIVLVRTF